MTAPEDSTNLTLVKVGRFGRVKVESKDGKKNEDAAAFKRLMAKMQEEAGPGGYLHGRGALDHDDVLYLKEQRAAELDAERMRDHNEKRAYLAFRAAANQADAQAGTTLLVEPKHRSGIRQQSLLKSLVEVKPKRQKRSHMEPSSSSERAGTGLSSASSQGGEGTMVGGSPGVTAGVPQNSEAVPRQSSGSALLGLAYEGSDDEEEEGPSRGAWEGGGNTGSGEGGEGGRGEKEREDKEGENEERKGRERREADGEGGEERNRTKKSN